jgi:transposase
MKPMKKLYKVALTEVERTELLALVGSGKADARRLRRARTLLLADEGYTDAAIASALHIGRATVERTRKRFAQEKLEAALTERPRPGGEPKLDAKQEAHLVALACSTPPKGKQRWALRALAGRMVALGMVDEISHETVRRSLKKIS